MAARRLPGPQFPDGDNWGDADNRRCVELTRQMVAGAAAVGYAEIAEGGYRSPLLGALAEIGDARFVTMSLHERRDVYRALRRFFHPPEAVRTPGES